MTGLDTEGPAAPPRKNGELIFAAPWESRAFGMALTLFERGLFEWDEFRGKLIDEIRSWERAHPDGGDVRYWERWLAALERLVAEKDWCPARDLERRTAEYAARPAGHDH